MDERDQELEDYGKLIWTFYTAMRQIRDIATEACKAIDEVKITAEEIWKSLEKKKSRN